MPISAAAHLRRCQDRAHAVQHALLRRRLGGQDLDGGASARMLQREVGERAADIDGETGSLHQVPGWLVGCRQSNKPARRWQGRAGESSARLRGMGVRNSPDSSRIIAWIFFEPPSLRPSKNPFIAVNRITEFQPCPASTSCMKTPPGCRRWPKPSTATGCPGPSGSCTRARFDLAAATARGRVLQPHERLVAHARPPLLCRTDRGGAGLADAVGAPRGQRVRRARSGNQQGAAIRGAGAARHRHAAHGAGRRARQYRAGRATAFRRPAGDPEAEPRRQGTWRAAFRQHRQPGRVRRKRRVGSRRSMG